MTCDIIRLTRKSLFLGLVLAIVISDSLIYFAQIQTKAFYSSWIISINASTAAALAIFVVYRHMQQRSHHQQDHDHSKSHVALASISPLIVFLTPFGILEIIAYGIAISRGGILSYQLIKDANKRNSWRKYVIPAIIEIGIVVIILFIAAIVEWQMIRTIGF